MFGWGTAPWVSTVRDWIEGTGSRVLRNPVERVTRPWSTVWTVETVDGRLWFKENCPPQRAEAAVHAAVARLAPEHVDAPIAVDAGRGWLLSQDGGSTLADATPGGTREVSAETLGNLLQDYAVLQRRTLGHRDALVSAGLEMATPSDAVRAARTQAIELAAHSASDPRRITVEQRDAVLSALPALERAAVVLRDGPVPLALDQCDLFPRNVFLPVAGSSRYRFFDFADATWAHPFGSLVMLAAELRRRWKLPTTGDALDCRDERIRAVFDAYLSCWTDFASTAELRELARCALRLAPLHRSAAWFKILGVADQPAIERHGRTPWAWLEDVTKPVLL